MYRHFLVPIADTPVSSANVACAIDLARSLHARVTFFHATPDWGATGEGALIQTVDPQLFAEASVGGTNALLAKAMASAKAAGVECAGLSRTCDRPAEAILDAADAQECDLIVMASRGASGPFGGWLHSSQTERVLRRASIALLVTRVESNLPISPRERALGVIEDEHRSLAVVAATMRDLVGQASDEDVIRDRVTLQCTVDYLRSFPERVHHPKEEAHLHHWLRERSPDTDALLVQVERQHVLELEHLERVSNCLAAAKPDGEGVAALRDSVKALAAHVLEHIAYEEREVLPLASRYLTEEDWADIARAFSANDDSRFGDLPADEFRWLFTRIANATAERRVVR
jgi:nucleotide-binding universal stress UspA family protein/hemerythrin-like domain-containing protein